MNPSLHAARVLPARAVLFLGIAGFHALLAYAFASGLISTTIAVLKPDKPIEIFEVKEKKPQPLPPPTPPPTQFTASTVDPLPIPPINPDMTPPPALSDPPVASVIGPTVGPGPVAPLPIRLVGRNVMPATADYYPASEIRFGKEGTTEIRSCVDVNGRLDGSPVVEASSGRPLLDKAAVRLAQDGTYARAMRGETPVPNCYRFRVTFTMRR